MNLANYWADLPRRGWLAHAICPSFDWRLWFNDDDPSMAKQICAHCPVSDDCLADALRKEPHLLKLRWGVFGGMSPEERHEFASLLTEAGIVFDGVAA